jgi:hypothetical protein
MESWVNGMDGCLAFSHNSAMQKALGHPSYTPAVRPRVLQQSAGLFRAQAHNLREAWTELAPAERQWWIDWANADIPEPKGLGRMFGFALMLTKWNLAFHQEDALEFFTALGMIRSPS